ncbi:hypothetical protein AAHK20_29985 [Trinickia sp. YCB016]
MTNITEGVQSNKNAQLLDGKAHTKWWVCMLVLNGLLLTLLWLYLEPTPRGVDRACLKNKMSDAHTLDEAFFQSPPDQNAIQQAIRACSH